MLTLFSAAMAMDCTGLDATLCEVVDDLEFRIEAIEGADVIGPDKEARLQPTAIYAQLDAARETIVSGGCAATTDFDGYEGGILGYGFPGGSFQGSWSTGGAEGTSDGNVNVRNKTLWGDYDGDASGMIGDSVGRFNNGQVFGSRADGFEAGYWIRLAGRRGVYVALFGQCDTGVEIDDAFDAWFPGALNATCDLEDTVLSYSNGSCLDCGAGYTLDTDPAIFWRLNETSGSTVTNLGNLGATGDGTIIGTLTTGVDGVDPDDFAISNGTGTNDRVRSLSGASGFGAGTELSTSVWLRTTNGNNRALVSYAVSGSDNNFLLFDFDNVTVYVQNVTRATGLNLQDGLWHHLVVTYVDGGALRVYLDGDLAYSSTIASRAVTPGGSLVLLQEQDNMDGGYTATQEWLGSIDEFASWDRILDANEVQNLYRSATCSL